MHNKRLVIIRFAHSDIGGGCAPLGHTGVSLGSVERIRYKVNYG